MVVGNKMTQPQQHTHKHTLSAAMNVLYYSYECARKQLQLLLLLLPDYFAVAQLFSFCICVLISQSLSLTHAGSAVFLIRISART